MIDGTGAPARAADVTVEGDRIAAVTLRGSRVPATGTEVVDLDGSSWAPASSTSTRTTTPRSSGTLT